TDAVPGEVLDEAQVRGDFAPPGLGGSVAVGDSSALGHRRDARSRDLLSRAGEPHMSRVRRLLTADEDGHRGIAVQTLDDGTAIDRHHVPGLQDAAIRDPADDDLADRAAERPRIPLGAREARPRTRP